MNDRCEASSTDCPGYNEVDELGAYCSVLVRFSGDKLKDFISKARLFRDRYKGVVEGADYEYTS